jgi:hypothetical protein
MAAFLIAQYLELKSTVSDLNKRLFRADANIDRLVESNREMKRDNIIAEAKAAEQAHKRPERVRR